MNNASDIERIAREYTPLVKAAAAKYQGRGAEYEDLVQEGYMALVILVPQCRDRQWLPLFLRNRVPYHVRDAAARLRGRANDGGEVLLEAIEETAGAEDEKYGEAELRETLRRTLTRGELDITQALMEGKGTVTEHKMFAKGDPGSGWGTNEGRIAAFDMTFSNGFTETNTM